MSVEEQASKRLSDFMEEMCRWERNFFEEKMRLVDEGGSTSDCNAKHTDALRRIFDKYVLGDPKTLARLDLPGISDPVMYDPARDYMHEAEVFKAKVIIKVDQADGFESSFRFTLTDDEGTWKITRKDTLRGGKWEKSSL